MSTAIDQALQLLRVGVADLDPDVHDGAQARRLTEQFAEIARLGEAGKTLMARRVRDTAAWAHEGYFADAATWLASVSKSSYGAARSTLDTADRLTDLPATEAAMRRGQLSPNQTNDLASAAAADPTAEAGLLDSAEHDGPRTFTEKCKRVKAAARSDELANYERIRKARSLRHWEDDDGAGRIDVRGPLDVTARIMKQIEPYANERFDEVRKSGAEYERAGAYAFDGLVAMADAAAGLRPPAKGGGADTALVVRIDLEALRGWTEPGEICEIVGAGPIPVAVALRMAQDAFLKAVVTDGVDVHQVVHLGRRPPAVLMTALHELYQHCVNEGCDATDNLEAEHNQPWSEGGETRLSNLNLACKPDHRHKHRHNLRFEGRGPRKRMVPAKEWSGPDPPPPPPRC